MKIIRQAILISFAMPGLSGFAFSQNIPDLTDGFVRVDIAGSGGFDGLTSYIEPAQLTPQAQEIVANLPGRQLGFDYQRENETPKQEGEVYVVTSGVCNYRAATLIQPDSSAFFLTQTPEMVTFTREEAGIRHIFMDGRQHPSSGNWTPNGTGHSIGWYEEDELVVETIGLTAGGVTAGGYRTPETVLLERFSLSEDGDMLTINYTWTDPEIYVKPHNYEIYYERLPADFGYAYEIWCDAGDPNSGTSIFIPEQL